MSKVTAATALTCAVVALTCLAGIPAASAQQATVNDASGDTLSGSGGDFAKLSVSHGRTKVRFTVRVHPDSFMAEAVDVFVDTRGSGGWDFDIQWGDEIPGEVYVFTRTYQHKCTPKTAQLTDGERKLTFSVPRRCLESPKKLRAKAVSAFLAADPPGPQDTTKYTKRVGRG